MLARTHVLLGISSLWLIEKVPTAVTPTNIPVLAAAATFGCVAAGPGRRPLPSQYRQRCWHPALRSRGARF